MSFAASVSSVCVRCCHCLYQASSPFVSSAALVCVECRPAQSSFLLLLRPRVSNSLHYSHLRKPLISRIFVAKEFSVQNKRVLEHFGWLRFLTKSAFVYTFSCACLCILLSFCLCGKKRFSCLFLVFLFIRVIVCINLFPEITLNRVCRRPKCFTFAPQNV